MSAETRDIEWGKDPHSYNINEPEEDTESDGSGNIGISLFSNALSVWVDRQAGNVTVGTAAVVFRCSDKSIREAVNDHSWMYLEGENICHDGE